VLAIGIFWLPCRPYSATITKMTMAFCNWGQGK
jgi:hypothetical protein